MSPSPTDTSVVVYDRSTKRYKPSEVTIEDVVDAGAGAEVYPPVPTSPNEKNDEFDGTSLVSWSNTPNQAAASEITSRPGHLRLRASGTNNNYVGLLQAVPAAFPYTIETKLVSSTIRAGSHRTGILLAEGVGQFSTMAMIGVRVNQNVSGAWFASAWNGSMSGGGQNAQTAEFPTTPRDLYLRVKLNSASSLDISMSGDAHVWSPIATNWNCGFTPTRMGLALNEEGAAIGTESSFEYFRVTN